MNDAPKPRRRWITLAPSILLLFATVAIILTVAIWFMPASSPAANGLIPSESTLLGEWMLVDPQGADTMRVLQFRPDHTATSTDVSTSSSHVIQSAQMHWRLSGTMLSIDERSRLQRLFGAQGETTDFRVESLTDQELTLATPNGAPIVYRRRDSTHEPTN